ncbi:MAG: 2-dehydropantoate 2-reductase [Reyranellaceae bacterium]
MRVLVLGAGGTGGYFGGRLAEIGRDVTFLVRPKRAAELAARGLVIKSKEGDATLPVKTASAERPGGPYDIVLLTCKAYDLPSAMDSIAGAVGPGTAIVPLLNGLKHLEALDARFGKERVVGGLCQIGVTLGPQNEILHLDFAQNLVFGERAGGASDRLARFAALFAGTKATGRQSGSIMLEMWEKFVFLCALAAMSTLFRNTLGNIVQAPEGEAIARECFDECLAVARASGFAPRPDYVARMVPLLVEKGAPRKGSMARDIERGNRVEADHIVGDMLARARALGVKAPILRVSYNALKAYEVARG